MIIPLRLWLRCGLLGLAGCLLLAGPGSARAADALASGPAASAASADVVDFNADMLAGDHARHTDLSRFEKPNLVAPGTYNVDLFLNGSWAGRVNVRFEAPAEGVSAVACFTSQLVDRMQLPGIDAADRARMETPGSCVTLDQLVNDATTRLDMGLLRLDATVPQSYLGTQPRGYIAPAAWDPGLNAFLFNYDANVFRTSSSGLDRSSAFVGIRAGLNLGLWHFRQNSTWSAISASSASTRTRWRNLDTYVSRDIPAWRARVTVGDSHTDGAVFDSLAVRGMQLASVDAMLPQSRRGYAPVIRGVARTNAKVEVSRDGQVIYQTTVPPGPFTINDLYASTAGGALSVTLTEANGETRSFTVPYASIRQLVRPGVVRFNVAAGRLRKRPGATQEPDVLLGTVQYGFNNTVTGYGGLQAANGYVAALVGGAINTRVGAFMADVTQAHARLPGSASRSGQNLRLGWSRIFPATRTNVDIAAYRYSTEGFLDLMDAVTARQYLRFGSNPFDRLGKLPRLPDGSVDYTRLTPDQRDALQAKHANPILDAQGLLNNRNRLTVAINQPAGDGSLYLTGSVTDYWNRSGTNRQYQAGYSNHFGRVNWSLSASRSYNLFRGQYEDQVFFSVNVPLGHKSYAPRLMMAASHDNQGRNSQRASLSGTAGRNHQYSYGATLEHATRSRRGNATTSGSINAGYSGSHLASRVKAAAGTGFNQQSAGISGGILATHAGINFTRSMGDTVALIHVPGAKGARVANAIGLNVGAHGYAVLPYLQPYQRNQIRIDPEGIPLAVALDATTATVAPYGGSVVQVDFATHNGRPMVARITRSDDSPVPFGAEVFNADEQSLGIVGQAGTVLLRGVQQQGQLVVRWQAPGDVRPQRCLTDYVAPGDKDSVYQPVPLTCTLPPDAAQQQAAGSTGEAP